MANSTGGLDRSAVSARFFRRPRRITITVPHHTHNTLVERSGSEGRSISNLAAFLLEQAISRNASSLSDGD